VGAASGAQIPRWGFRRNPVAHARTATTTTPLSLYIYHIPSLESLDYTDEESRRISFAHI